MPISYDDVIRHIKELNKNYFPQREAKAYFDFKPLGELPAQSSTVLGSPSTHFNSLSLNDSGMVDDGGGTGPNSPISSPITSSILHRRSIHSPHFSPLNMGESASSPLASPLSATGPNSPIDRRIPSPMSIEVEPITTPADLSARVARSSAPIVSPRRSIHARSPSELSEHAPQRKLAPAELFAQLKRPGHRPPAAIYEEEREQAFINNMNKTLKEFANDDPELLASEPQKIKQLLLQLHTCIQKAAINDQLTLNTISNWWQTILIQVRQQLNLYSVNDEDTHSLFVEVIDALTGCDDRYQSPNHIDKDGNGIISLPEALIDYLAIPGKPISKRFENLDSLNLANSFPDLSLLETDQEMFAFGTVKLRDVVAKMRKGGHKKSVHMFSKQQGFRNLKPQDINTPPHHKRKIPTSPWRKPAAELAAQHTVVELFLKKINELFQSTYKLTSKTSLKIVGILLGADKNPILPALQMIVSFMQKQGLHVINHSTLEGMPGFFKIDMKNSTTLTLQFFISFTELVTNEHLHLIGQDDASIILEMCCDIDLDTFGISNKKCELTVSDKMILTRLKQSLLPSRIDIYSLKSAVFTFFQKQKAIDYFNFFSYVIPVNKILLEDYTTRTELITPHYLTEGIRNNRLGFTLDDIRHKACKDYPRGLVINGHILPPDEFTEESGLIDLEKLFNFIRGIFFNWSELQQNMMDILISQQVFDPIETVYLRIERAIGGKEDGTLVFPGAKPGWKVMVGEDPTLRFYNLTWDDKKNKFCIHGIREVKEMALFFMDGRDTQSEKNENPYLVYEMKVWLPSLKDEGFEYSQPIIRLNPSFASSINKRIVLSRLVNMHTYYSKEIADSSRPTILASIIKNEKNGTGITL